LGYYAVWTGKFVTMSRGIVLSLYSGGINVCLLDPEDEGTNDSSKRQGQLTRAL
jgi:hypothetical protein